MYLKLLFWDVHGRGCDFSKGVSSLSSVCLASNVDSLEDDDACSDDVSLDSESDGIDISSSGESTLPAKHTDDNEETPLKKSHPPPWTSKKEVLDTIKKLYFMCDDNDNIEHLYILPSRWLYLPQFEEFSDEIYEFFKILAVRQ